MQIEAGKFYRTRDGRKVGPMRPWGDDAFYTNVDGVERVFDKDTGEHHYGMHDLDLIAEWVDKLPHGHARLPSGAVVYLTAITTPFGLLDEVYGPGAQEALRAHGGPWEVFVAMLERRGGEWKTIDPVWTPALAVRVKPQPPAPVVETVTLLTGAVYKWVAEPESECGDRNTHRITFDLIDGVPDCASIRMVSL